MARRSAASAAKRRERFMKGVAVFIAFLFISSLFLTAYTLFTGG